MKKIALILTLAGILDSAYLLYTEMLPNCPFGTCASISIFFFPPYVPAFLGLGWFIASLLIFTLGTGSAVLQVWRFAGISGMAFLATYALLNSYFCPFCFTAYGLGILLVWISEREFS
ncbi:hypothetical protein [Archaeoglobus neptunius]|uniref:hypothetical protein n=1 Tax=Archaeoglobus neptunius TaxID=2798580 RepID=UPI00192899E1|nr:hypothetical protein [Archaeoglobus neptunius]